MFQQPRNNFLRPEKTLSRLYITTFHPFFHSFFIPFSFIFVPFSSVFVTFHLFSSLFHSFFITFSSLFRHFFVISTTFTTISTTSTTNSTTIKRSDKQSINYKSGGSGNKISKKIFGDEWLVHLPSPEKGNLHVTQGAYPWAINSLSFQDFVCR